MDFIGKRDSQDDKGKEDDEKSKEIRSKEKEDEEKRKEKKSIRKEDEEKKKEIRSKAKEDEEKKKDIISKEEEQEKIKKNRKLKSMEIDGNEEVESKADGENVSKPSKKMKRKKNQMDESSIKRRFV